jgi:hypothetical protein
MLPPYLTTFLILIIIASVLDTETVDVVAARPSRGFYWPPRCRT